MRSVTPILVLLAVAGWVRAGESAPPQAPVAANNGSKFRSAEDGWLDVSGFLDERYGFLPVVIPITEPAVSYDGAGGLAFIGKPEGEAQVGFGRPNITAVGGLGTDNGSWGALAGDLRYWLEDRLQTLAGVVYSSVNLEFHGVGEDSVLADDPLRYNLEPKGGMLQRKFRISDSRVWAGLSYALTATDVSFEAPAGTPGLPDFASDSNVGGLTPSVTYDTRNNIFTPTRGTHVKATGGTGFRYEAARRHGIHMGLDVAFGPDNTAVHVQVGSAWARP